MKQNDFINVKRMIEGKKPGLLKWLPGFVISYLERILHQKQINEFLSRDNSINQEFCTNVMHFVGVSATIDGIENIPKHGKCVLAMNHPLGGMDAILLVEALKNHRTDVKFIVNDLLLNLGRLNDIFVGVNKIGKNKSTALQKVNDLFSSDECVCIFPAGMVSRKENGIVKDLTWKRTFVKQSRINNQTIIPIHIEGELTKDFYRLANFRKKLGLKVNIEMLFLADEMFKQKGRNVHFTIGKPILALDLPKEKSDEELSEWFRSHVYSLKK